MMCMMSTVLEKMWKRIITNMNKEHTTSSLAYVLNIIWPSTLFSLSASPVIKTQCYNFMVLCHVIATVRPSLTTCILHQICPHNWWMCFLCCAVVGYLEAASTTTLSQRKQTITKPHSATSMTSRKPFPLTTGNWILAVPQPDRPGWFCTVKNKAEMKVLIPACFVILHRP